MSFWVLLGCWVCTVGFTGRKCTSMPQHYFKKLKMKCGAQGCMQGPWFDHELTCSPHVPVGFFQFLPSLPKLWRVKQCVSVL